MFVTIYGRFETPHELELVRRGLIDQGVPNEDISLVREDNGILVHTEQEMQEEIRNLMQERGAQDLDVRAQPTMDRGLEKHEIWQGRKKQVSSDEAGKMPHAGPLDSAADPH